MAAFTAAGIAGGFSFPAAAGERPGPNIILLIADNLGWRDLGCYGDPSAISPNLDRIAEQGARFTNAFVTAPSCSPSRASIISGQSPHSVNVLGLTHLYPRYQMPTSTPTIPAMLRKARYTTAIDGKWHVSPFKPVSSFGYKNHLEMFEINDSAAARTFISKNRDSGFYLEMNFMQTHRPALHGRGNDFKQHPDFPVDPEKIKIPGYWNLPDWPEIKEDVAAYYSQAAAMDSIIGGVMEQLEADGIADNTLVVFVSDNGPMYPGMIGSCHDRGIATPLLLRWPGHLPAGKTIDALASTIDIMPTCLDATGIPTPEVVQGKSLIPLAKGGVPEIHDAVFAEMTYHVKHTPMRAIRTRKFKYIENMSSEPVGLDMCENFDWAKKVAKLPGQKCCVPRPPEELYDLAADPNEMNNLADDPAFSGKKKDLIERLHAWRKQTRDPVGI